MYEQAKKNCETEKIICQQTNAPGATFRNFASEANRLGIVIIDPANY